jgi:hypothetical protein
MFIHVVSKWLRVARRTLVMRLACAVSLSCIELQGCVGEIAAPEPAEEAQNDVELALEPAALTLRSARALRFGTRQTLVTGIAAAENLLFSSSGRLYASGDNGVFELSRSAAGEVIATGLLRVDGCNFGGMSERAATLYAVCYDTARSQLYAASETATPSFAKVFELSDIAVGNGMATDGANLYITATGQGTIVRLALDPSDPLRVVQRSSFMDDTGGLLPNGIKVRDGVLYWGDFGALRRTTLVAPNPLDVQIDAATFFDDFSLNDQGVLIADYLFGALRQYDRRGFLIGSTPSVFDSPSSVVEANGRLGFGMRDLIVTEKGGNSVAVFHY